MPPLTFYSVFAGTFLSIAGWLYLIVHKHDSSNPRTLSELAAHENALGYFRTVLWVCGGLFAVTLFGFILPRLHDGWLLIASGFGMIFFEMMLGIFPAKGRTFRLHNVLSYLMAISMGLLALSFAWSLSGTYAVIEYIFTICIALLGLLGVLDKKHLVYYEVPFIFISHFSVMVAALAVRYV